MKKRKNKKHLIKKIKYVLDNRLRNGVYGLVKFLLIIIVIFIIITVIIFKVVLKYEIGEAIFNVMPTIINGWLPFYDEGKTGKEIISLIFLTVVALFGVFFTSVFIGLITSTIEQRLMFIKDNRTKVYEKKHIIILGFNDNIYALVSEIIQGNENRKICIVIAANQSCDDMKNLLCSNIKIPKNVRIVFRTIDVSNVEDLQKLSIKTSEKVIINLTTNFLTLQILLSLNNLYKLENINNIKAYALIYRDNHNFVKCIDNKNFVIFELNKIITKLIARASNGHGLANVYKDIFNYENFELYTEKVKQFVGKNFIDVIDNTYDAIPIGLISKQRYIINPNENEVIKPNDKIIMLEEKENSYNIMKKKIDMTENKNVKINVEKKKKRCSIIGENETMDLLKKEFADSFLKCKYYKNKVEIFDDDKIISKIADESNSIVILNDHDANDRKQEDIFNTFIMKKFENYRIEHNLDYFITLELSENANKWHTEKEKGIDFIIASDLHSQLLAQISERNELLNVFSELISVEGYEINEISISSGETNKEFYIYELRNILYKKGYILIGYYDKNTRDIIYAIDLKSKIGVGKNSYFIVVSSN